MLVPPGADPTDYTILDYTMEETNTFAFNALNRRLKARKAKWHRVCRGRGMGPYGAGSCDHARKGVREQAGSPQSRGLEE